MKQFTKNALTIMASLALIAPLASGTINVDARSVKRPIRVRKGFPRFRVVRVNNVKSQINHLKKQMKSLKSKINRESDVYSYKGKDSKGHAIYSRVNSIDIKLSKKYNRDKKQVIKLQKLLKYSKVVNQTQHKIKHYQKGHTYYKGFAYNKREYKLYEEMLPGVKEQVSAEKNQLKYNQQPAKTKKGIDDAINNAFTLKLKNNSQYRKGYMDVLNLNAKSAEHLQVMEYIQSPSGKKVSVFNVKQLYKAQTKNLRGQTPVQGLKSSAHQNRL